MITQQIVSAILKLAKPTERLLIVHSSLSNFKFPRTINFKFQVQQALLSLLQNGFSLVIPSFTFSYTKGNPFDLLRSSSEVGILGDWARELGGFIRTPNPLFSVVTAGKNAQDILACNHEDAYGSDSVIASWEKLNGRIIMLGASWATCTFLHRMEHEFQVPYRYEKIFTFPADFGNGLTRPTLKAYVRNPEIKTEINFGIISTTAREEGLISTTHLNQGIVESIAVKQLAEHCRKKLAEDIYFLVKKL